MKADDKKPLLHLLRNPHGWSEDTVRDARIKAADELERLWNMERSAKMSAQDLMSILEGQS